MVTLDSSARVVAVVQARMGSTRLPGKVLRELGGRSVLDWVIRAATCAAGVDAVVVATTMDTRDDEVASVARGLGAGVVRGPEDDVVARFSMAAEQSKADAVVRLTADCPLLDPLLIAQVVAIWRTDPTLDYVATTLHRSLPRGLDVELVSSPALRSVDESATGSDRVHVTSALYAEDSTARRAGVIVAPSAHRFRVTLDEEDDGRALDAIVDELGDSPPAWRDLVRLLESREDIVALNSRVTQKPLELG